MDDKVKDLIYYVPLNAEENRFFEEIEKALGLKLFAWQKTYILAGSFRRFGKTTAECIRELTSNKFLAIDFSEPPRSNREKFHRDELLKIKQKLTEHGIKTNPVIFTKAEKREFEIMLKRRDKQNEPQAMEKGLQKAIWLQSADKRR